MTNPQHSQIRHWREELELLADAEATRRTADEQLMQAEAAVVSIAAEAAERGAVAEQLAARALAAAEQLVQADIVTPSAKVDSVWAAAATSRLGGGRNAMEDRCHPEVDGDVPDGALGDKSDTVHFQAAVLMGHPWFPKVSAAELKSPAATCEVAVPPLRSLPPVGAVAEISWAFSAWRTQTWRGARSRLSTAEAARQALASKLANADLMNAALAHRNVYLDLRARHTEELCRQGVDERRAIEERLDAAEATAERAAVLTAKAAKIQAAAIEELRRLQLLEDVNDWDECGASTEAVPLD